MRLRVFCVRPLLHYACLMLVVSILGERAGAAEQTAPFATVEQSRNEEIDRAVQRTWREFCDRLHANDTEGALAQLSEYARLQFAPTFRDLGTQLHKLSEGWSDIRLSKVVGNYATYYVTSTYNGRTTSHFITFALAEDGKWYIESL